jgi:hypothetical protein
MCDILFDSKQEYQIDELTGYLLDLIAGRVNHSDEALNSLILMR